MDQDKLREWEQKCIQEEPPECTASCPIHVDARLFVKEMGRGDHEAAYKVLAKTMPFPGILGRICDYPCELRCKRGKVEAPIAIGLLERRCVENATTRQKIQILSKRSQRVAVVGAGLAGLTAAWDLLKKGFAVTVIDQGDRLGGTLWDLSESVLPRELLAAELAVLEGLKAEIRLNTLLDGAAFAALESEYDALFIDREQVAGCALPLGLDESGRIAMDSATGATERSGVFAGGGTGQGKAWSPVTEALQGRKGALSIERFVQNAQMVAGRENEGPFATRLFASIAGVTPTPRVIPRESAIGFTADEAYAEAGRCLQCECMECVKVCLYLERYDGYPKKYARQVFNNERVIFGAAHTKNQFVNSCSGCGLCETVCPNGFSMGDLCLEARRTMAAQRLMPASFHEFALQDLAHSTGERFALSRHQAGKSASAWAYFPSCQLCATAPMEVLSSYRFLKERLDGGVGIMLGCCGAPAYWAGREDIFAETVAALRQEWEGLGRPNVITACATCLSLFREHLPDMGSVSIWQVLEETGLPAVAQCRAAGSTVSIADPCITRHDPEIRAQVRRIAQALGILIDELALSGDMPECCGYGGLMYNANPKLANEVIDHRATADAAPPAKPYAQPGGWFRTARQEGADTAYYRTEVKEHDYLAYCAMCRDRLAAAGKRASHLMELLFPAVAGGDPAGRGWISWSERRTNRGRVKEALLRELGERGEVSMALYENITLLMTEVVRQRIDERRILEDDIRRVIDHGERSGQRLRNNETGAFRASLQPEHVTFWVDYSPEGDGFRVLNAFCHRMQILGVK